MLNESVAIKNSLSFSLSLSLSHTHTHTHSHRHTQRDTRTYTVISGFEGSGSLCAGRWPCRLQLLPSACSKARVAVCTVLLLLTPCAPTSKPSQPIITDQHPGSTQLIHLVMETDTWGLVKNYKPHVFIYV